MIIKKSDREGILFKTFNFKEELKVEEGEKYGIIRGYASTFGNVDKAGDRFLRGCFEESIKSEMTVPVLKMHSGFDPIGINEDAYENARGLKVRGRIDIRNNSTALEQFSLAKMKAELGGKMGLSIGFIGQIGGWAENEPLVYEFHKVQLIEYSFTFWPMNEKARIDSVEEVEKSLKSRIGDQVLKNYFDAYEKKESKEESLARVKSFFDFDLMCDRLKEVYEVPTKENFENNLSKEEKDKIEEIRKSFIT